LKHHTILDFITLPLPPTPLPLMILRISLFLIFSLFKILLADTEFKCNQLLNAGGEEASLRTFEYINPKTKGRGVVCVSLLNRAETLLMYLEEETTVGTGSGTGTGIRKQAVGRAQLQSPSPPGTRLYTGVIHVTNNIIDPHEDLFDLNNSPFTLSLALETGLVSFSIKPKLSSDNIVYIWQPRTSVPRWSMHVNIPKSCGVKSYTINDPIPRPSKDRDGIVCVLEESPTILRFFSFGWKKSGQSGNPRKFVNFGSLRLATPNFLNIYTGRIHSIAFPCGCNLENDRLNFKETFLITAVRSSTRKSLMIYGDLQEEWHDIGIRIEPNFMPRYPLLPINLNTDFSADLRQIYGLSSNLKLNKKLI
jgi:hypothetical protein